MHLEISYLDHKLSSFFLLLTLISYTLLSSGVSVKLIRPKYAPLTKGFPLPLAMLDLTISPTLKTSLKKHLYLKFLGGFKSAMR